MSMITNVKKKHCKKKNAVEYRPLKSNDALKVVQLHIAVFPDYFLTSLGVEFLKRYYKELIEQNELSVGAYWDEQLAGFIVGGRNVGLAQSDFYRKNFLFCCFSLGIALIRSSRVRKGILGRISHIFRAIRSRIKSDKDCAPQRGSNFRLLSIAVYPEFRGSGVAEDMLKTFNGNLSLRQVESYGLTVKKDNKRAIFYYRKAGMTVEKETGKSMCFRKWLRSDEAVS